MPTGSPRDARRSPTDAAPGRDPVGEPSRDGCPDDEDRRLDRADLNAADPQGDKNDERDGADGGGHPRRALLRTDEPTEHDTDGDDQEGHVTTSACEESCHGRTLAAGGAIGFP